MKKLEKKIVLLVPPPSQPLQIITVSHLVCSIPILFICINTHVSVRVCIHLYIVSFVIFT